jgi:phage terminase large subunit-like protein
VNAARIVQQYVDDVLSGKLVTGQLQRAAVQRYVDDLKRTKKAGCPFYFDQNKAEFAIAFLQLLPLTESEWCGKPFVLSPWQMFIVWNLWGFRRVTDGCRRFRWAWIEIARKNGKSEFAAALSCLLFHADGENKPDTYTAATKRQQAAIVFGKAVTMTQLRPFLASRCKYMESKGYLIRPDKGVLQAVASDGRSADGLSPHGVFFDELHEWKAKKHLTLWSKLTTGSGVRPQPLFVCITTAGDDQSVLWAREREYAVKLCNGVIQDDARFTFVCCVDDDDDWSDESVWIKANPNLNISVKIESLRELAHKAASVPEALNDFRRYHLNQRVASVNRAISEELWKRGSGTLPILAGRLCHAGIDIGFRDDLAAFALAFPPRSNTEPWFLKCWNFGPTVSKRNWSAEPFRTWIQDGRLVLTPGNTTDANAIYQTADEAKAVYNLKSIAIDPNNARILGTELVTRGHKVYEFNQWARNWNEPFREVLKLFADGRIAHGDDPVLTWCAQHLMSHTTAGLIRPAKEHSTEKIDPLVAVLMALAEGLFYKSRNPQETGDGPRIRIL